MTPKNRTPTDASGEIQTHTEGNATRYGDTDTGRLVEEARLRQQALNRLRYESKYRLKG